MLVETFSDVKDFEAYFSFMEYSTKMAEQAQTNAQKSDRKNSEKIAQLKRTIEQESSTLEDIENEIRNKEDEASNFAGLLKVLSKAKKLQSCLLMSIDV